MDKQFDTVFYQQIYDLIYKKNRNCLIICVGDTGTSKSYTALKIAHTLDPTFEKNMDTRIVYKPRDFIKLVVDRENELKKGMAVIFDEAGTGLAAREWHSQNNKAIDYILQTFRRRQLLCIFTVPNMSFIDTHARRLFHFYVECLGVDFNRNLSRAKVMRLSYNKMKPDDPYRKYLRKQDGRKAISIKRNNFKKVPARIWHKYEEMADKLKDEIEVASLERSIVKPKEAPFDPVAKADEIWNNGIDAYIKDWHGRKIINLDLLSAELGIGGRRAMKVKALLENKMQTTSREGNVKVESEGAIFT